MSKCWPKSAVKLTNIGSAQHEYIFSGRSRVVYRPRMHKRVEHSRVSRATFSSVYGVRQRTTPQTGIQWSLRLVDCNE